MSKIILNIIIYISLFYIWIRKIIGLPIKTKTKMSKEIKYSISLQELIERPDIRNDYKGNMKWLNKMTDEEIDQFNEESCAMCIEEGVPEKFPDLNAALLTKSIDRGILYDIFLLGDNKTNKDE